MNVSLLSLDFLLFSVVAVALVSTTRGAARQAFFLALNAGFVWYLLGTSGLISTVAFCLLGYALIKANIRFEKATPLYTVPPFVVLFVYMQNYEMIRWIVPNDVLTNMLRTIGLSFLLFKIIHVLIDAKSKTLHGLTLFGYLNYCLNFTTFMMGPIQRFQDYHDQWHQKKQAIELTFEAHLDAVLRILFGLTKVYILAVAFSRLALQPDTDVVHLSLAGWVVRLYGFFFYLYMNFSGYCDVVIGIGSLMGVRPPENFNLPFMAQNISDFWQRQHRSLTLWLTDYVFSPTYKSALSSNLLSSRPVVSGNLALMLTMLVSGLWHGTTIGFLFFGLAHGIFLVIYHSWDHFLAGRLGRRRANNLRKHWLARGVGIFLTFNAASFAFLFFQLDTPHLMSLFDAVLGR